MPGTHPVYTTRVYVPVYIPGLMPSLYTRVGVPPSCLPVYPGVQCVLPVWQHRPGAVR